MICNCVTCSLLRHARSYWRAEARCSDIHSLTCHILIRAWDAMASTSTRTSRCIQEQMRRGAHPKQYPALGPTLQHAAVSTVQYSALESFHHLRSLSYRYRARCAHPALPKPNPQPCAHDDNTHACFRCCVNSPCRRHYIACRATRALAACSRRLPPCADRSARTLPAALAAHTRSSWRSQCRAHSQLCRRSSPPSTDRPLPALFSTHPTPARSTS